MSQQPIREIISRKLEKIRELRARGIDPYPARAARTHTAREIATSALDRMVATAGRLVQVRVMGKASFAHIQDGTGKLQLYFKKDLLGESYDSFKDDLAIGDFIGAQGRVFKTKTGEVTVEVHRWTLLAKALRPLPEKWHGLQDPELRHRHRHLDLIGNPQVREQFALRSRIVEAVRQTLNARGFLEVETPVLIPHAGGAAARPFQTHQRALDMRLYLRIATELYLKRLVIGGFERVYELGRIFRNEGVDTRHNPEFTMLEAYQAYADYNDMADLLEAILAACAQAVARSQSHYRGQQVNLTPPFPRLRLPELWKQGCGQDIHEVLYGKRFRRERLLALADRLGVEAQPQTPSSKVFERIFDSRILPQLREPTFVFDHPTAITPLAKALPDDEALVERFEFFMGGEELANAYSELNDPLDQRERFAEQARLRLEEKEEEVELLDEDFVEALEVGMPPTGGIGVGIDRLAMVFLGQPSIREVILFPTLRPATEATQAKEATRAPTTEGSPGHTCEDAEGMA